MRFLRRLSRNERGVTAIETAIVFPTLIYVSLLALDFLLMMFVQVLIEGGAREAARYGITGYVVTGVAREQQIRTIIQENIPKIVDMSKLTISDVTYPSFDSIGQPEPFTDSNGNGVYDLGEPFNDVNGNGRWDPDMGASGAGGPGDVVVYTIEYVWTVPLARPLAGLGVPTEQRLQAKIVVRNEPFPRT
jgi:hypothetical protein